MTNGCARALQGWWPPETLRVGTTPLFDEVMEIREVLLQVMAHCGAPAAFAAMRVVQQVLEDLSGEAEPN